MLMFHRYAGLLPTVVLLVPAWAGPAAAQEKDSTLTARQLFYTERSKPAKPAPAAKPAPPANQAKNRTKSDSRPNTTPASPAAEAAPPQATADVAPFLGVRYSVLRLTAESRLQEVNPDGVFRSGDRIKVKVTPNSKGYLYVVHQGTSGNWDVLFPTAAFRQGSNAVERLESLTVPEGEYDFTFDEKTGTERLFLVLSAQPERDLDALIYSLKGGGKAGSERVLMAESRPVIPASGIERFRSSLVSRDLKVDRRPTAPSSSKREEAVYVVNASDSKDSQRVVAEIALRHQ
jgi:hypothetical protein